MNSFCGPLRQPAPQDPAAAGCALVDMDALVASSDHLRNMQRTLSRAPSQPHDIPALNPVPAPSDDRFRFGAHVTRMRKSAMPTGVVDRIEGELAVVEWTDGGWSDLPLELLPETTGDGDTVALSLRTRPRGSVHITGPHADLVITPSGSWRLPAPPPSFNRASLAASLFHPVLFEAHKGASTRSKTP